MYRLDRKQHWSNGALEFDLYLAALSLRRIFVTSEFQHFNNPLLHHATIPSFFDPLAFFLHKVLASCILFDYFFQRFKRIYYIFI